MKFQVNSALSYQISGPTTLLCSLRCIRDKRQHISGESLTTSRKVAQQEISLGLAENRFTKFDTGEKGDLTIEYRATAECSYRTAVVAETGWENVSQLHESVLPYLFPSRYVPSDRMRVIAGDLFGYLEGPLTIALAVEDWLYQRIYYQTGSSDEQTSALSTFEKRSGVCRDFAHLGIAFCRALTIPARYLTVYAHELVPQDFHAVFEVFVDGKWFLIDGTRKAPLNGMVRLAIGRDASDAAVATLFGNVYGTAVKVAADFVSEKDGDEFLPVTRETLRAAGEAIYL